VPHLSIEYSDNLEPEVDLNRFCRAMLRQMLATGLFETGAVRVRAFRAAACAIADEAPANSFVDMSLRMGAGRSAEEKKAAGNSVFAAAADFLADRFESPHFALSLEIREIDPALSWKKNTMHARLRGK